MFSSITSLFGLFSSSTCDTHVTVIIGQSQDSALQPEIYSQKEIINQLMLARQKIQNYSYQDNCSQTNDITNKCLRISKNLIEAIRDKCHRFAIHFFANKLASDPTIKNDENRWVELFAIIEECIQKPLKEISSCCQGIAIGYCEEAGLPKFAAKTFQLVDPIYFEDSTKYVTPSDYLMHLLSIAQERMPHFLEMQNFDAKILDNLGLAGKKPVEGITWSMSNFLRKRIEKIAID